MATLRGRHRNPGPMSLCVTAFRASIEIFCVLRNAGGLFGSLDTPIVSGFLFSVKQIIK